MQGFGYFLGQIKYNFIYFTRIDSGYARIRRYVSALNRRAARLGKKNIRLCVCPAERDRTFEGSLLGRRSKIQQKLHICKLYLHKFAIYRIYNVLSKGFTLKSFTRLGFRRAQLLGLGERT